jgi:hypothetical protein
MSVKVDGEEFSIRREFVGFVHLKDESVLLLYENIRNQVDAERWLAHKFMTGRSVKQHAADLREELVRRRLDHMPIKWHRHEADETDSR